MKMLSLDQSLNVTGWAYFENEKLINYGNFSIKKTLPMEMRLNEFQKAILETMNSCGDGYPDIIVFEDIQNQQNNITYKHLAYVQAALMIICYNLNIKYSILSPSSWRAALGGGFGRKREEQKQAAIEYVQAKCNKNVSSDEADAICIGLAYMKEKKRNESAF